MAEKSGRRASIDRETEQAMVALKKGAHLLKCGRRGKPKFCPFRLSTDEKTLVWYSGEKEKNLKLNTVSKVVEGQKTVNFLRLPQPEKESQSFSLIYQNGERSLDLICKDRVQAECWVLGLKSLLSISLQTRPSANLRTGRSAHSCLNSPISHVPTKYTLKALQNSTRLQQVCSVYGSPPRTLVHKYISDGFLGSSDIFYSLKKRTLSDVQNLVDDKLPLLSHKKHSYHVKEQLMNLSNKMSKSNCGSVASDKADSLKDVFMWGEGVGVFFGDRINAFAVDGSNIDVLLPKLLESTQMLDVRSISCGEKHAALVTKQGEVFCWGEGNGGKLGHKINLDVTYPMVIETLKGSYVQSVACGSRHTYAVSSSGELFTWGESSIHKGDSRSHWIPHRILNHLGGIQVSKVACGEWHTAIVSFCGKLFTYGEGTFGALGHGDVKSSSQPKEVESLKGLRVKTVACGLWHTAAIVEIIISRFKSNSPSGKLFTWGDNNKGSLGHSDKERKLLPTCIASLVDCDFVQVSCGRTITIALTVTGLVFTMGSSMHGQLGNPQAEDTSITMVEGSLKSEFVKDISSGSFHVAVLTTKGNVYTWGKGDNGRLGLGDTKDRDSPSIVEALQDRSVQNIVCGSSFTTAICLHKSLSSKDQSLCTGCRMAFGFTRKKHNCYNCGCVFCHSCSSKKTMHAALAPNKIRRCRVCDLCFTRLENLSTPVLKDEVASPRQITETGKGPSDMKSNRDESLFFLPKIFTPKASIREGTSLEDGKSLTRSLELRKDTPYISGAQRWGQVSCPPRFDSGTREESMVVRKSKERTSGDVPLHGLQIVKPLLPKAASLKQDLTELDKLLTEELQLLHAKAITLAQQCRSRSKKIQQYKRRIEETWLIARDEAANCKAAKDVIKVLKAQMDAFAEGSEKDLNYLVKDKVTERWLNDLLKSEHSGSETKKIGNNGIPSGRCILGSQAKAEERKCSANASKHEIVEQDELGVYISYAILPNGQKGLKRVRFSRKQFSQKGAEKWWDENKCRIFQKYQFESNWMMPNS
ncbi:Ultraviolet-B receptor UVR8 [Apostasia shenzhenica]|uniref:Ultraviolet-B receptor UVR8 n=1 Tax=Apostasia shenzhenica TaxID=1088818 RepID=A0A2I0ALU0_9ASPA|nr:Ultraviolet-B receptor UVR8 [Apostasia shenzhenica]